MAFDMAQMVCHQRGSLCAITRQKRIDDGLVVVVTAVRRPCRTKNADNQRGPRHQLFHHPQQHRIARDLCQKRVELPRQSDRLMALAMNIGGVFAFQM